MHCAGGNEQNVTGLEDDWRAPVDLILQRPFENVDNLLAGVLVALRALLRV